MIIINHLELRLKSGLLSFRFASFRSEVFEKIASSFNAKSDLKVFVFTSNSEQRRKIRK